MGHQVSLAHMLCCRPTPLLEERAQEPLGDWRPSAMVTSLATAKTVPLSLCTFTASCAGAEVTTGSLSLFFTSQLQYYNKIH